MASPWSLKGAHTHNHLWRLADSWRARSCQGDGNTIVTYCHIMHWRCHYVATCFCKHTVCKSSLQKRRNWTEIQLTCSGTQLDSAASPLRAVTLKNFNHHSLFLHIFFSRTEPLNSGDKYDPCPYGFVEI